MNIHEIVTNKIIEKLEQGVIPWQQPFQSGVAVNWLTQRKYRGINALLLDSGEYATFKQIKEHGGKIKKGEKGHIVIFWKLIEVEDEETGEMKKVPFARYYRVFEINTQVEGLKSRRKFVEKEHDPIEKAEEVRQRYTEPNFSYESKGAWYNPAEDLINVPPMKEFRSAEDFYSVLFHEMIHSTGHKDRLNREGITKTNRFGDATYSKEELIAEIGASMLCAEVGIFNKTVDNSASYIDSWLRVLKQDSRFILQVAQQAQKAADYVMGRKYED